jgi:hypothetical protein
MENIHNEMCMFEKYAKQVNDLLVDSYKWKLLAEHDDNREYRQKYEHISHTLYELYLDEHKHMEAKIKA